MESSDALGSVRCDFVVCSSEVKEESSVIGGDVDDRLITLPAYYIPPEPTRVSYLNHPKALIDN